jgi:hypothetical protein
MDLDEIVDVMSSVMYKVHSVPLKDHYIAYLTVNCTQLKSRTTGIGD